MVRSLASLHSDRGRGTHENLNRASIAILKNLNFTLQVNGKWKEERLVGQAGSNEGPCIS